MSLLGRCRAFPVRLAALSFGTTRLLEGLKELEYSRDWPHAHAHGQARVVMMPRRHANLHLALWLLQTISLFSSHEKSSLPWHGKTTHTPSHTHFTMKIILLILFMLAQTFAGLVVFNSSADWQSENAGHVDDSRTVWPIVTTTVSTLGSVLCATCEHDSLCSPLEAATSSDSALRL